MESNCCYDCLQSTSGLCPKHSHYGWISTSLISTMESICVICKQVKKNGRYVKMSFICDECIERIKDGK